LLEIDVRIYLKSGFWSPAKSAGSSKRSGLCSVSFAGQDARQAGVFEMDSKEKPRSCVTPGPKEVRMPIGIGTLWAYIVYIGPFLATFNAAFIQGPKTLLKTETESCALAKTEDPV